MDRPPALLLLRDAPPFLSGEVVQQASSFEVLPGLLSLSSRFAFNTINFTVIVITFITAGVFLRPHEGPTLRRRQHGVANLTVVAPPPFQCVCWGGRLAGLVV